MKHALWLLLLLLGLASPLPAQPQQVIVPAITTPWTANNFPMAGPRMRYQQWFAPGEFAVAPGHPVRITALDLIGGAPGGQAGAFVDLEVTMANGPATAPSVLMDSNLTNSAAPFPRAPVVVVPRGTGPTVGRHQLVTAASGLPAMSLPFQQAFVWDGISSVVVDIKVFDNGKNNGNQAYSYDLQYTFRGQGKTWRLYGFSTDPRTVTTATHSGSGEGIAMQFTYEEGVSVSYGGGCPGAGGFVPVASTSGGLPFGGNGSWTQVLTNANSQQNAFLLLGASNTSWGAIPLPLDLMIIGGFNCQLWTAIHCAFPVTTVGGGPGAGTVILPFPVPPVVLTGLEAYTQWMIIDTGTPARTVVMSQALRHIFG